MDSEKPNYYAILTADVRYDKNLSAMSKLLFAEITALSQKEGYAWASNKYFGDLYGVDKDAVSRWMSELVRAQYVKIEVNKEAGNLRKVYIMGGILKSAYPIRKNEDRYTQNRRDPIRKNADITIQENNIENRGAAGLSNSPPAQNQEPASNVRPDYRGLHSPAKERLREMVKEGTFSGNLKP